MRKFLHIILALIILFCCSCTKSDPPTVSNTEQPSTIDTESFKADGTSKPMVERWTKESATKKASNIMYALCVGIDSSLDDRNGKASFLFIPLYEFKGEVAKDSGDIVKIRVLGDQENYSYRNTYSRDNPYELWLVYDQENDVYIDLLANTNSLIDDTTTADRQELDSYAESIKKMNSSESGLIYSLMKTGDDSLS